MAFGALTVLDQVGLVSKRVSDPRGTMPSGVPSLDQLLYRGGFQPGLFCIMGGRTHTRKTTITANMIARMLKAGRNVGFIGLDETQAQYTLKIMSAMYGLPHEFIENNWNTEGGIELRTRFLDDAAKLTLTAGYRPNMDELNVWLDEAEVNGARPEVVFLDYISLLARDKYDGGETQRIMRLIEKLQVWTNEQELVTIALHQLNRGGDEGEHPVNLSDLKHGGEEIADIVMASYRPALDPIGNVDFDEAQAISDKQLTEDEWEKHRNRVERFRNSTLLQLIKNRPGTKLDKQGIELLSVGETMQMRTPDEKEIPYIDGHGGDVSDIANSGGSGDSRPEERV